MALGTGATVMVGSAVCSALADAPPDVRTAVRSLDSQRGCAYHDRCSIIREVV